MHASPYWSLFPNSYASMTWISFLKSVIVITFYLFFLSDKEGGIIIETNNNHFPSLEEEFPYQFW